MRKYLYIWQKIIIFSSIDKIIQTSLNIIHDRVFTFKKRSFEQWNSPPGALYQIPQPGLTTEIKSPPNGHVLMDEQFSAVIHVKQTMKRSNAPILTMIRNLWSISGCHEIILNVMCDVKLATIQNEINAFLSQNITVTIVDNTENCNSFAGYYAVRPMLKPVLHLTDEVRDPRTRAGRSCAAPGPQK